MSYPKLYSIALKAIAVAESILVRHWMATNAKRGSVRKAGPADYHVNVERQIEIAVGKLVRRQFPSHSIVGEEFYTERESDGVNWYIDPIDGTRNLVSNRSEIAVSIAAYRSGHPLVAVISMPLRRLRVSCYEGLERRILVQGSRTYRRRQGFADELVGVQGDIHRHEEASGISRVYSALVSRGWGLRATGALAYDLASISIGELGARISLAAKPMDVAAGAFLVSRVGGVVTDVEGKNWSPNSRSILAGRTRDIHKRVLRTIAT